MSRAPDLTPTRLAALRAVAAAEAERAAGNQWALPQVRGLTLGSLVVRRLVAYELSYRPGRGSRPPRRVELPYLTEDGKAALAEA